MFVLLEGNQFYSGSSEETVNPTLPDKTLWSFIVIFLSMCLRLLQLYPTNKILMGCKWLIQTSTGKLEAIDITKPTLKSIYVRK